MVDMVLESPAEITLEDLLRRQDERVEIIHGVLCEMSAAGLLHHFIIGNFVFVLQPYIRQHDIGVLFTDGLTYLMGEDHKRLKYSFVPDVSFIRKENFPAGWDISRPHPGVPDLAIEVVSPGDDADTLGSKIRLYLDKGTAQVWVAYPSIRTVHQFIRGNDPQTMTETANVYNRLDQHIDAAALFPGLVLTLADLFHLPPWVEQPA